MSSTKKHVEEKLRAILDDVLGIGPERAEALDDDSGLFGTMPELDSMAVATLLTEMEDRLDIIIDDDEIEGSIFETFGTLLAFATQKVENRKG